MQLQTSIDAQGRILVPKRLRRQLGLVPGQTIHLDVEGDRLIVQTADDSRCGTCGQALVGHVDHD